MEEALENLEVCKNISSGRMRRMTIRMFQHIAPRVRKSSGKKKIPIIGTSEKIVSLSEERGERDATTEEKLGKEKSFFMVLGSVNKMFMR